MGFSPVWARFPSFALPQVGAEFALQHEKTKNVSAAQSDPAILDVASMMEYQC